MCLVTEEVVREGGAADTRGGGAFGQLMIRVLLFNFCLQELIMGGEGRGGEGKAKEGTTRLYNIALVKLAALRN